MVTHDETVKQSHEHYIITGVAPGTDYDPTIDLLFPDDDDTPTVKRAAIINTTQKLPLIHFAGGER